MKRFLYTLALIIFMTTACGPTLRPVATPTLAEPTLPAATPTPLPPIAMQTLAPTPTPGYPPEGYGPTNFPADVDPLTGLKVANPALLERRPLAVKISNLPRYVRPQWGLSLADLVYEYYTEEGTTRFTVVFYGQDAEVVGPIRSARFFDANIIRAYKAVFAFGSAYEKVIERLFNAEYADRLVVESPDSPLRRYDPSGYNHLVVNTAELSAYITKKGIPNGRQNLDGMFFQLQPPAGGQPVEHAYVRYSGAIYNRWDYDATSGKYLRFSETEDDVNNAPNEKYAQLTDRLTSQPIAFDNMVVLLVTHVYYNRNPVVVDMLFTGSGTAYAFRDGQVYQVQWQRQAADSVVSLTTEDGQPFPFKPGTTWFEVMGINSQVKPDDQGWRFTFQIP
ncbi:MAG: DUF3048 domain-containing protein [Chloroflexi bacterium]|nr:DUF3048 domain-containing protein [Chloroflexota bacterium]